MNVATCILHRSTSPHMWIDLVRAYIWAGGFVVAPRKCSCFARQSRVTKSESLRCVPVQDKNSEGRGVMWQMWRTRDSATSYRCQMESSWVMEISIWSCLFAELPYADTELCNSSLNSWNGLDWCNVQLEMGNHDSRRERKGGGGGEMIYDGHAEMHYDLELEEALFKHTWYLICTRHHPANTGHLRYMGNCGPVGQNWWLWES